MYIVDNQNVLCYISSEYTQQKIENYYFLKQAYFAYFRIKVGNLNKSWVPPS